MQQEVDGINKACALEVATYDQHEYNPEEFRSAMKERHPAHLGLYDFHDNEQFWQDVISLDRQLLDATVDLYRLIAQNPENIRYVDGNLVSNDAAVWNSFVAKRKHCIDLRQRLRRLVPKQLLA